MGKFLGLLYTDLTFTLISARLFVVLLDSAGLSLVNCEYLLFSGVNFETSGLVYITLILKGHFSDIFVRHIFDVGTLFATNYKSIMSVCMLGYKHNEVRQKYDTYH